MKSNNQYWGLPLEDLELLAWERIVLFNHAWRIGQYKDAQAHEKELSLIMDAVVQYERGGN